MHVTLLGCTRRLKKQSLNEGGLSILLNGVNPTTLRTAYSARDWNVDKPLEIFNPHAWTKEAKSLVGGESIANVWRKDVSHALMVNKTARVREIEHLVVPFLPYDGRIKSAV